MIVTLTHDEICEALLEKAVEKTNESLGLGNIDNLYFDVIAAGKDIEDIEQIKCSIDFN